MTDDQRPTDVLKFERDQLARDLRASVARREALEGKVRELGLEAVKGRREAEAAELRARVAEQRAAAFQAGGDESGAAAPERPGRDKLKRDRERRELIAELMAARAELELRVGQLIDLRGSRFHRVAGTTWHLRRARPMLVAAAACLAVLGLALAAIVATSDAALFAAPLGLLALALLAILARRAARRHGLAEDRWRERLRKESTRVAEIDADGLALDGAPAAPAPAAGAAVRVERVVERRLVPAPLGAASVGDPQALLTTRTDPRQIRVAAVLDEMSHACFAPECELEPVGRLDWRAELEARPPHLLLVESAWNGNGGAWQWSVASYPTGPEVGLPSLRAMVAWCRERDIPTVFWNKEDPVHFERFSEAAGLFDHVFTTDADQVAAYEALGSKVLRTVAPLPFAFQPRLHNPVGALGARDGRPAFAGTYYRDRHEARRSDLELLLDAARPLGLVIYDRTLGSENDEFGFPERFQPHVRGRLSYEETLAAYRRHALFLNVNSVVDSPTMCSRRVLELLACGTPVVSTPARALTELLGDAVTTVASAEEAAAELDRLLHDEDQRRAAAARGRAALTTEHTYAARLFTILRTAGFDLPDQRRSDVAALVVVGDAAAFARLAGEIAEQRLAPQEVLVGSPADLAVDGPLANLRDGLPGTRVRLVHQQAELPYSQRARELAALSTTTWVAPLAEGRSYPADHLEALMGCTAYGDIEVAGRDDGPRLTATEQHTYVDLLHPDTAIARRDDVARWGWPDAPDGLAAWFRRGARLYRAEDPVAEKAQWTPPGRASRSTQS